MITRQHLLDAAHKSTDGSAYMLTQAAYAMETLQSQLHQALAERKPLPGDAIEDLADEHLRYQIQDYDVGGVFDFARAIERAHNIREAT